MVKKGSESGGRGGGGLWVASAKRMQPAHPNGPVVHDALRREEGAVTLQLGCSGTRYGWSEHQPVVEVVVLEYLRFSGEEASRG